VDSVYAAGDLFVFPSLHEGAGTSLLRAMAFGLPVLALARGGVSEIIEDGGNGILVAKASAEALAWAASGLGSQGDAGRPGAKGALIVGGAGGRCVAIFGRSHGGRYRSYFRGTDFPRCRRPINLLCGQKEKRRMPSARAAGADSRKICLRQFFRPRPPYPCRLFPEADSGPRTQWPTGSRNSRPTAKPSSRRRSQ
jgi:hypothetical protein